MVLDRDEEKCLSELACPRPIRASSISTSAAAPGTYEEQSRSQSLGRNQGQSAKPSRFTPTTTPGISKRPSSPFLHPAASIQSQTRREKAPINWKRVIIALILVVGVSLISTLVALVVPKRPVLYLKRVSVPSSSSYAISSSGQSITVSGQGTIIGRMHNPNHLLKLTLSDIALEAFWVGYQGDDSDYFDTAPLATGHLSTDGASGSAAGHQSPPTLELYPRDTLDIALQTVFNHTGVHNVDPMWLDFIRRCLNQDEESRKLRMVFRVSVVVGRGWWGERRQSYLAPQDLPCPMTPSEIVDLFKDMKLAPPEQSQIN